MGSAARSFDSDAPPSDPALTSREAAKMLGVSITTAQMWMETGLLASWKTPGGHRRTRLSSVQSLLGSGRVKPSGDAAAPAPGEVAPFARPEATAADTALLIAQAMQGKQAEARFQRLLWLASALLKLPIALLTSVSGEFQIVHAAHGLNLAATPSSWAFFDYAQSEDDMFMVSDTSQDPRLANHPMVTAAPFVRFYAGFRLMYRGQAFGSLCLMDTEPRLLRAHEKRAMRELAALASDMLALQIMECQHQGTRPQA